MLHIYGGDQDNGADKKFDGQERGRSTVSPTLQISNPNAAAEESSERERIRYSFDVGPSAADYDVTARNSGLMTDHDHGLGLSGLRRIRQQPAPIRTSAASSFPGQTLNRSSSMTLNMIGINEPKIPFSPGSPAFTEDLSRFPSESLHSFSFAHQSEDFIHSRQNVLKRSFEFMRDRMGWSVASNAALASAQARVTGDLDTQIMLDFLAQAKLVGAGNLPKSDATVLLGPLSGPPDLSGDNVFDKYFKPRSKSPDQTDDMFTVPPKDTAAPSSETQKKLSMEKAVACPKTMAHVERDDTIEGDLYSGHSLRMRTNESETTSKPSSPPSRRPSLLKRTYTDTYSISMQQKLMDAMAKPFLAEEFNCSAPSTSPLPSQPFSSAANPLAIMSSSSNHHHSSRWAPAAQAIFTTEARPPWTILAANDLACLVFGVTKAEVRKMGILEVVQEDRKAWLEQQLQKGSILNSDRGPEVAPPNLIIQPSSLMGTRAGGITVKLLSKPNSRWQPKKNSQGRRPATIHCGDQKPPKVRYGHHSSSKSRGVLLCGDVVPIRKRNGATGAASLWVKEKRIGLIWVLEEIHENVAYVGLDEDGIVTKLSGALGPIWGDNSLRPGKDIGQLIPRIPRQGINPRAGEIDYAQVTKRRYFTCRNRGTLNIPATIDQVRGKPELRVSSFPHIAGIIVVDTKTLAIKSSNMVFCGALFGHEKPDGMSITDLLPNFDKVLRVLADEDGIHFVDGIVVPEHSFRKASALLALKQGLSDVNTTFPRPDGLPARHRDGSELKIDVQMRVVKSEKQLSMAEDTVTEEHAIAPDDGSDPVSLAQSEAESVLALWITYSRHLHAIRTNPGAASLIPFGTASPLHQPSPGQTPAHTPVDQFDFDEPNKKETANIAVTRQLKEVVMSAAARITGLARTPENEKRRPSTAEAIEPPPKKSIDDFIVLENMGQGAYGQVKLARHKDSSKKCVLKYVTKRRILVDTWTRDRRLGTVPLEIHVLDYLRLDGFRHPNIVEMEDFFEDDVNYYIEMMPHGMPGMDLFDYIELRTNMEERECRNIFVQVAQAIYHLHTKALVVHRDIKDENVVLDGEGNIKLIDFGSAAYIKSGPFDVFVGTIDYAAPEVLAGKPYGGKEQDVWALGILLYTIIYKENPFYSIDEIMDRDLRVPYTISDDSIDLVRRMLNRDVAERLSIEQVLAHSWCAVEN